MMVINSIDVIPIIKNSALLNLPVLCLFASSISALLFYVIHQCFVYLCHSSSLTSFPRSYSNDNWLGYKLVCAALLLFCLIHCIPRLLHQCFVILRHSLSFTSFIVSYIIPCLNSNNSWRGNWGRSWDSNWRVNSHQIHGTVIVLFHLNGHLRQLIRQTWFFRKGFFIC